MAQGYLLSESDRRELQELIAWKRRVIGGSPRQAVDWVEHQAPEVYLVRAPATGIPALSLGSNTGTGPTDGDDDTPGSATCEVYRVVTLEGTKRLRPTGGTIPVHNFALSRIQPGQWCLIHRDKFGTWWAQGFLSDVRCVNDELEVVS